MSFESHLPSIQATLWPERSMTCPLQTGRSQALVTARQGKGITIKAYETALSPAPLQLASLKCRTQTSPVVMFITSIRPIVSMYFLPATRLRLWYVGRAYGQQTGSGGGENNRATTTHMYDDGLVQVNFSPVLLSKTNVEPSGWISMDVTGWFEGQVSREIIECGTRVGNAYWRFAAWRRKFPTSSNPHRRHERPGMREISSASEALTEEAASG